MTDTIIGVYTISNTISVLVYDIDYATDRVLAGFAEDNDMFHCKAAEEPEWCDMCDEYNENEEEWMFGFKLGCLFIPFSEVLRAYS